MLKHQRNSLVTIDVPPGVSVIDIVIISAWGRRVDAAKQDSRCVNTCCSGLVMMGSSEGMMGRGRGKLIC